MDGVTTGTVTQAVRDASLNGVDIHENDYIGFTGKNMAERMVEVFLTTEFEGGRHERRVNKMMALEQE